MPLASPLNGELKSVINDITWVGGFPFFYPLVASSLYELGGILGVRIFNVILGTVSVLLIYFQMLNIFKAFNISKNFLYFH
jgi:hypothetical protein